MSLFGQLIKHSAIYGIANILSRVIGFVMIPVYTRFLSPQDYGVIELLDLTVSVISTVIGLRMNAAIFRYYYDYKDEKERKELISTALLSVSALTMAVVAICSLFRAQFSLLLFKSEAYADYFLIIFATLFFQILIEYCYVYIQVKQRSVTYGMVSLCRLVIGFSLNILFVVVMRKGPLGILYSGLITSALVGSFLAVRTFSETSWKFSGSKLGLMVQFGAPLIFSSFSTFVLTFSDRYFLNHYAPLAEVGLYSLGYKFGILVSFLITGPFLSIWNPKRFETAKEANSSEISSRAFTYFSMVVVLASLAVTVVIKDVLHYVTTPAFYGAWKYVPLVVLGYVFNSWYYHFNYGIYIKNQTRYIAYIWMSGAAVNLLLNWLLIKWFHGMGAAAATALSYLYVSAATYFISHRLLPIAYELGKVGKLLLLGAGIYLGTLFIRIDITLLSLAVKSLAVLAYPAAVYYGGFLNAGEKTQLREAVAAGARKIGIGRSIKAREA